MEDKSLPRPHDYKPMAGESYGKGKGYETSGLIEES